MAGAQPRLFYQRHCHAQGCRALFFICRSCYRGQRYCTQACRELTRREQRRAANRRHQQSPEGRLDHRDHQRAYRQRLLLRRVTDQGSAGEFASGTISRSDPIEPKTGRPVPRRVCCIVCGRRGRFVEIFQRRE